MSDFRETTFCWTVHNFDVASQLSGERLESPVFSIDPMKHSKFSLLLFPRSASKKVKNYISLFVRRHDDKASKINLRVELCLLDGSGNAINVTNTSTEVLPKNRMWGCNNFLRRSSLLHSPRLLPDNMLTVRCRMVPTQDETEREYMDSLSDCEVLSQNFAELLESGVHSDLTIEAGGKEFRVHKAILEARCPKLLSSLLVKTESSSVMALQNLEEHVLQAILHYAYTGIFKSIDKLDQVFAAANAYALADLKALVFPYSSFIAAKTVIECSETSFDWMIPDFANFLQSNKELSYFLISDDVPECCWMKVSLFVEKMDGGRKGTFLKFQKLRSYYTGAARFKIQAYDENDKLILLKESENLFEHGKFIIPFDAAGANSVNALVNGNLKLLFSIRASVKRDVQSSVQKVHFENAQSSTLDVNKNWKSLQEDLRRYYDNLMAGDVTLNVGPRKLAAHKAVLCSRSEVFGKMFQHDSQESRTNTVNIEDVDADTMTSVLMYMYCGMTGDLMDVPEAVRMYSAADKYQLPLLKEKCCRFLKSRIDAENVGDVLLLADAHSDEGLKECVKTFVTANAAAIMRSKRGLKALGNRGDLYQDILSGLLQRVSDQDNNKK